MTDKHVLRTLLMGVVLVRVTTNVVRSRAVGRRRRRFVDLAAG
jgi:hypothetical protein